MTDAALLVDRFVSSTSATDAHDSLQALLDALKANEISPATIWNDDALLQALMDVLSMGKHGHVPLEEGPSLVCRIYQYLSKQEGSSVLLSRPSPGILMQNLLDVVSNTQESDYVRVLGLQILNTLCTKHPSVAQSQLLEIPNGLHRVADIMGEPNDQVRNELLGGVSQIIGKWPSCAKIWVFGEVCNTLMEICIREGGLSGSILVGDCLDLVESLVDPSLADLIWQSPTFAPQLASLLDLRGGSEFLNPPTVTDDLDDILANKQALPKLTFKEEDIIRRVLRILGILLDNKSTRRLIWTQHAPLCSLVWELALFAPASSKPVCAAPSPKLQQEALEYTGQYFHSPEILKRHHGVDRLLYLVCTGGGASQKSKMGLSQAALFVLRQTLTPKEAQDILTHSLAPPTDGEPAPTAVTKLLNTVFENLESSTELERRRINLVGALGALGVFLDTPTNREVMLAIAPTLVDALLTSAEKQEDTMVTFAILRFACEWVVESPTVVQAFLASAHSTCLSSLVHVEWVGSFMGFLLGLCMEYMSTDEEKHGGWTRQSIMELLGKKGGISGYQTRLEKFKTTDLPWSACLLEKQRFLNWYSALVLVIRRRVVQELTRGDEDDGDESNASTKSMNRMVTQQAKELEELRASLNDAKATIMSQEGQLAVWKRRVESTPTQLDDMLTEYTRKNAEMEKTVTSLKTQIQENQDTLQAQVQERDDQIAKLQETVREWQEREREAQEERGNLHEELQGLTSAYTSLEQEYNRRTQGAGEDSGVQPEGEVSHQEQTFSGEQLSSLQAENARLRADALAADDWMAMAVQRMNDIGGQNLMLQQEVATLREQMQQATLTGGIVSTGISKQQLEEERQHRQEAEKRLHGSEVANTRLQEEITVLRQQLEQSVAGTADAAVPEDLQRRLKEEEGRRQHIEAELCNSQKDTATALDSLGDAKTEKEHLERHIASTEKELEKARSEIAALVEERHRMEAELVSLEKDPKNSAEVTADAEERDALLVTKDGELECMRSLLASKDSELVVLRQELTQSRQGLESKAEEMTFLQDHVQSLMQDLESVQTDLGKDACREREEIHKRDAKISELESRLMQNEQQSREVGASDAAGFFGSSSTDGRDEEIDRLRAANEAAQEWMAKAVEHHQMLSEQVTALVEDKAALTKQIEELQLSASIAAPSKPEAAANKNIGRLERDLSRCTDEVTELGARIIKLESEIRIKETEMADAQEKAALCDKLQEQVLLLEEDYVSEVEKRRSLEDQIFQLLSEKESSDAELNNLRQELDETNQLTAESAATSLDEMESLNNLMIERDAQLEILRDELKTAKDAFVDADQLRMTSQNALDESSRLKADLQDALSKLAALQDKTASLEQLQAELQMMRDDASRLEADREAEQASLNRLRDEIDSFERDRASLTMERDSLKEMVAEMQTKLDEFDSWAGASQQKITELQIEKESVEQQLVSLEESVKESRDQLDSYREKVAVKSTDLLMVREELGELMALKVELYSRLERTQLENNNLLGKNSSLEQNLKVLETQHNKLLERSNEAETLAKQKEKALQALEDNVTELQAALEAMQEQSAGVVDAEREELESTVAEFEETLQKQQEEALDAVNQWSTMYSQLETLKSELEETLQTQQEEALDAVNQWSTRYSELETLKSELEETLLKEQKKARDAVNQQSTRYSELETLKSEVERELEMVSRERDELSRILESERESFGKDAVSRIEIDFAEAKADWDVEKERLQSQVDVLEAAAVVSSHNLVAAEEQVSRMKSVAKEMEDAWKGRVSELEASVQELDQTLVQGREEASEAISRWESHCSALEERTAQLENELKAVAKERDELSLNMEKSVEPLREQLDQAMSARIGLEAENKLIVQQIEGVKAQSEEIVNQWKERVHELESLVQELEEQLELQQEEATRAISQWESRCSDLDEKVVKLVDEQKEAAMVMSQWESRCGDLDEKVVKLVDELLERSSEEADKKPNEELNRRMEQVQSLQERIKELESQISDQALIQNRTYELERALENERETVRVTEASLESKRELTEMLETELRLLREEVESEASETLVALSKERATRDVAERSLAALQESVSETEKALADLRSKEEQIFQGSRQDVDRTQRLLEEKESQLNKVIQERDDLKAMVGELQEDLRDASEALQACVTDEISEKAAEAASQALRYQMEQLRSQFEKDRELRLREKRARLAAEEEAESLKTDLANVLGIIGCHADSQRQIQIMTMRASEEFQRRERTEIEELRKALKRALKELASAQAAERNASANAAASRLQLSVCEQEVISAKSDLAFLTQTLEETREADASKAASLEYRISSLEDDREVLRRFHADELENLRNELTHVSMEKDRILHSLKESEKKNAAIVFSTSRKGESHESASPDAELARLRIEKAQLLSAAAEEGSRAERRIREAVAAHVSSVEADVILERELRAAAEAAVEDMKIHLEELKSKANEVSEKDGSAAEKEKTGAGSTSVLEKLSAELKRLEEKNRTMSTDNAALQKQLERAKKESSADIMDLTEKWRKAQARAHMLESTVSFDAEVNAQVAKLRATDGADAGSSGTWIVMSDNPIDNDQSPGLSAVDAYDFVHEQKIAIQEERALYLELLAEHDDLLALLAQQDLEKASLHAALARVAGQEAVDDAMAVAEENAVHQFGRYVKLT